MGVKGVSGPPPLKIMKVNMSEEFKIGEQRIKPFENNYRGGNDKICRGDLCIPKQTWDGQKWVDNENYEEIV